MKLPNFLIVEAQKCGTTSLYEILTAHPEVGMSIIKKINYFTFEKKYKKGLNYYETYFNDIDNDKLVIGEASPGYICTPGVPERIKSDLDKIKIVIILRDPIKRAYSQYWDNRRHLNEHLSEEEIVDKYLEVNYSQGRRGYFSRGVYAPQVKKYFDLFGRENVCVMILEKLVKNQTDQLHELYEFLGINKLKGLQSLPKPVNSSVVWKNPIYQLFFKHHSWAKFLPKRGKRLIFVGDVEKYNYSIPSGKILEKLKNFYEPHNNQLSNLINRPLNEWQ